jgi:hypothetical protein
MECNYCGESHEHVVIIPKPNFFIWKSKILNCVQAFSKQDLICLECLNYELNEIKED